MMNRRDFMGATAALATGMVLGAAPDGAAQSTKAGALLPVTQVKEPAAIAMWDFSWLLRHHPAGEFWDWSRVLDELVDRGYNAVRIDMFPALVAARPDGTVTEEYFITKKYW